MSNALPNVTVVIPQLNGIDDIPACLAALSQQDYPQELLQIIVVDNGSTDGSQALLAASPITYLLCPKPGRANALNLGLAHAKGSIICSTDISCIPAKNWISTIVRLFEDETIGCVAGDIIQRDKAENEATEFQSRLNYMSPLHAQQRTALPYLPYADGANASFRKAVFDKVGGFEGDFFKAADVEICYRLLMLTDYKIAFCKEALVYEAAEADLKSLFKQRYRIGLGECLLAAKFPLLYANRQHSKSIKAYYWQWTQLRQARNSVKDSLLLLAMDWTQAWGRRQGQNKVPASIVPISAQQLAQFMAQAEPMTNRIEPDERVSLLLQLSEDNTV